MQAVRADLGYWAAGPRNGSAAPGHIKEDSPAVADSPDVARAASVALRPVQWRQRIGADDAKQQNELRERRTRGSDHRSADCVRIKRSRATSQPVSCSRSSSTHLAIAAQRMILNAMLHNNTHWHATALTSPTSTLYPLGMQFLNTVAAREAKYLRADAANDPVVRVHSERGARYAVAVVFPDLASRWYRFDFRSGRCAALTGGGGRTLWFGA
jgi:hypothetical protein